MLLASARSSRCCLQALNVNAEGDGHGAQRTLSVPRHGRHLALAWYAILGIVLGGLMVIGLATAVFARRRTRRAYQVTGLRSTEGVVPIVCVNLLSLPSSRSCFSCSSILLGRHFRFCSLAPSLTTASYAAHVLQAVAARFSGMRLPQFRASAGGWRLPAAWGMVQRIGSGSSAGSAAPSEASAPGVPGI